MFAFDWEFVCSFVLFLVAHYIVAAKREMVVAARAFRLLGVRARRRCTPLSDGLGTLHCNFMLPALLLQSDFFQTFGRLRLVSAALRASGLFNLVVADRMSKIGDNLRAMFEHEAANFRLEQVAALVAEDFLFVTTFGPRVVDLLVAAESAERIGEGKPTTEAAKTIK